MGPTEGSAEEARKRESDEMALALPQERTMHRAHEHTCTRAHEHTCTRAPCTVHRAPCTVRAHAHSVHMHTRDAHTHARTRELWSRHSSPQQRGSAEQTGSAEQRGSAEQQGPGGTRAPLRVHLQRSMARRRNAVPLFLSQEMIARARLTVVAEDLTRRRREHAARIAQWKRQKAERARRAPMAARPAVDGWVLGWPGAGPDGGMQRTACVSQRTHTSDAFQAGGARPISPLYLPCISRLAELDAMMGAARELLARKASVLQMSARRKILRQVRGGV